MPVGDIVVPLEFGVWQRRFLLFLLIIYRLRLGSRPWSKRSFVFAGPGFVWHRQRSIA